jgi:hypothetical protein
MIRPALVTLAALALLTPAAASADVPDAELFATNNTALITDAEDPRLDDELKSFRRTVERLIDRGGGKPRDSELLDGVFFSSDLGGTTFERSRSFDVDRVSDRELREIADAVRSRFLQQSVLTFDHLHRGDRDVNAIELEVPGVSAEALRAGLLADPEAQERLFGGSVTLDQHLILVAALEDADLAREFAERIGGDLSRARTRFGEREFVEGSSPVRMEGGTLAVDGGPGADTVRLRHDATSIDIELNGREFELADTFDLFEVRVDLGAGDGRPDRVTIDATGDDEQISVSQFSGDPVVLGPAFVRFVGAEPTDRLTIDGNDGGDIISASTAAMMLTFDGGKGADVLLGGPGPDRLIGGDDFDDVSGRGGDDVALLGGDFDRFTWNPGDGSDTVDGGPSRDSMFFRGTDGAEVFGVAARGRDVRFTRDVGNIVMDLEDLEEIDTLAAGGTDTVTIDDLSRTPVQLVDVSLANSFSAPPGDGAADRIEVEGTDRADAMTLTGRVVVAGTATLTGLAWTVNASHTEGALDTLAIDTGAGDTLDTSAFAPETIGLEVR